MVAKRRLLALALSVQVLGGITLVAQAAPAFTDTQGNKYEPYIEYLQTKNVIVGYNDEAYMPYRYITREEYNNILERAAKYTRAKTVMKGYPDSEFRPHKYLTRLEALVALAKVTQQDPLLEKISDEKTDQILKNYKDAYRIPDWARNDVAFTIHHNIFRTSRKGVNYVDPYARVQRGQAAQYISNMLQHNEMLGNRELITVDKDWSQVVANKKVKFTTPFHAPPPKPVVTSTIATPISSEFSEVGDEVVFVIDEPMLAPNRMVIPTGSKLTARLVEVQPATLDEEAVVKVEIYQIATPTNDIYSVKGHVATSDGTLRGSSMETVNRREGTYDVLKNTYKREAGAVKAISPDADKFNVNNKYYMTEDMKDDVRYSFLHKNEKEFVLLGVGDQVKIKLDTAPSKIN